MTPTKKVGVSKEKCDYCEKEMDRRNGELYNYCLDCLNIIENRGYNQALKDALREINTQEINNKSQWVFNFRQKLMKVIEGLRKK